MMLLIARFALALLSAMAVGWTALAIGGHTDASGRLGLVAGAAAFVLVSVGWRQGRRGWLRGLALASITCGAMLAHFWIRLDRLP
jgi:hypothetical protein